LTENGKVNLVQKREDVTGNNSVFDFVVVKLIYKKQQFLLFVTPKKQK